jgi:UDP-N-acetyl-2-amino-2-deoxyglucuronate dehydrogenase
MRVGLVGGGGISATHAQAALAIPGVSIAAIQGTNEEKVRTLCARFGGTPYTRFETFLSQRPMDFVVLGSPSGLHAEQGMAAVAQGLHVLVEKPIDITTCRADALIEAAEKADLRLGVIFQDRFKPGPARLKQALDEGRLGKPILVDARVPWYRPPEYYATSRWRGTLALDGGGALINQAIHTLDLLIWLLGDVARVQARTSTLLHEIEAEDSGAAILEFACGALGTFTFTTAAYPGYSRRIAVTGTLGTMVLEQDEVITLDLVGGVPEPQGEGKPGAVPKPPAGAVDQPASSPLVSDIGPHRAVFEDFISAIRDRRAPRCDGRESRRSLALVEAIYQASNR